MIRQLRLSIFLLRQFMSVPYFILVMVMTTVATTLVQFLSFQAFGQISTTQGWMRAGIIGMWTTSTAAAGIIGFERHKGTLVYLVGAPIGAWRGLAAVVSSAASFGLAAFPVAWLTWALLSGTWDFTPWRWQLPLSIGLLWVGCTSISFVIAALFVLTPNAISYEGLLLVPMFIASGVLFTTTSPPAWLAGVGALLPLSIPVSWLLEQNVSTESLVGWTVVLVGWLVVAGMAGRYALWRATKQGTLEII